MTQFPALQRRTFLRGLGAALAVPFMESALPRSAWASAANAGKPPLRMAFLFIPNGAHMPDWTPATEGPGFILPRTLEPLAGVQQKIQVLSGLSHAQGFALGDGAGDHARSAATFLTGVHPVKTDGKGIQAGISVDQIAAQQLGKTTRFSSLELGIEEGRLAGGCDSGYSCAYSNNISWRSPTMPAGKEVNPRQLFDRMFGGGGEEDRSQSRAKRDLERKSILDLVQQDARGLRRQLAQSDARKLDQYLEGVREIEKRIDAPADELYVDDQLNRPRGVPNGYDKHSRLMGDLLAVALQADMTRVASWMFANEGSDRSYQLIDVAEGHHSLSHHQGDAEKQAKIAKINRFHMEQFAHFLGRLDAVREADGSTLLDNTMVVYGSGLGDGNRHNHDDLPIILAGGGAAGFVGGRHLKYDTGTPLMNLYLKMLHAADVKVDAVGDSTAPLANIDVA
ncbi:DUF1552 domain-containing protein [Lacipirellula limnantheis]|uniref:DUF1552 domain-containing protein n=1 Tax=Lacipirellula limnantheis TaxID=2528024 RepID=A0A517U481_9BACT|nr:DUF1552 domain-containing protein [Lacipirellula limnantheis]QDT75430.1 hypothetical protein I41_46400 [Lacipirellula limnantheis]